MVYGGHLVGNDGRIRFAIYKDVIVGELMSMEQPIRLKRLKP